MSTRKTIAEIAQESQNHEPRRSPDPSTINMYFSDDRAASHNTLFLCLFSGVSAGFCKLGRAIVTAWYSGIVFVRSYFLTLG